MKNDSVVAFIHAKGHSKRVKNKNIKKLKNKPLIYYAIKNALHELGLDEFQKISFDDENKRIDKEKSDITESKSPLFEISFPDLKLCPPTKLEYPEITSSIQKKYILPSMIDHFHD